LIKSRTGIHNGQAWPERTMAQPRWPLPASIFNFWAGWLGSFSGQRRDARGTGIDGWGCTASIGNRLDLAAMTFSAA
jgi:hypothetical protein